MPFLSAKILNLLCFLPQPGILLFPKLGHDYLTNVAVGCLIGNIVFSRPIFSDRFSCFPT